MVLPFTSKPDNTAQPPNEPPRILTEEEQILLSIDQGVHEVKQKQFKCSFPNNIHLIIVFFPLSLL